MSLRASGGTWNTEGSVSSASRLQPSPKRQQWLRLATDWSPSPPSRSRRSSAGARGDGGTRGWNRRRSERLSRLESARLSPLRGRTSKSATAVHRNICSLHKIYGNSTPRLPAEERPRVQTRASRGRRRSSLLGRRTMRPRYVRRNSCRLCRRQSRAHSRRTPYASTLTLRTFGSSWRLLSFAMPINRMCSSRLTPTERVLVQALSSPRPHPLLADLCPKSRRLVHGGPLSTYDPRTCPLEVVESGVCAKVLCVDSISRNPTCRPSRSRKSSTTCDFRFLTSLRRIRWRSSKLPTST